MGQGGSAEFKEGAGKCSDENWTYVDTGPDVSGKVTHVSAAPNTQEKIVSTVSICLRHQFFDYTCVSVYIWSNPVSYLTPLILLPR